MLGWEGGEGEGLKSQRPRRRKQAVQVARPTTWPSSACQPKRARARAESLMLLLFVSMREGVVGVPAVGFGGFDGGAGDGGRREGASSCWIEDRLKPSGVEGFGGSSEAMAAKDA